MRTRSTKTKKLLLNKKRYKEKFVSYMKETWSVYAENKLTVDRNEV